MKADKKTVQKVWRDLFISLLLYALPVLLMLLSFKITGQKPWKHKAAAATTTSK